MSGEGGSGSDGGARVSREELMRIAGLARIRPEEDEVARLVRDLNRVLDHVAALEEVDVSTAGVGDGPGAVEARFRDRGLPPDPLERAPGDLAPDWRDGFFVVPRLPAVEAEREEGT